MKYFHEEKNFLIANFEFKNFMEALKFVNSIAEICEAENHHPNIMLHNYRFVEVSTTTHEKGYILTEKDYSLAEKIEESYRR